VQYHVHIYIYIYIYKDSNQIQPFLKYIKEDEINNISSKSTPSDVIEF